MVVNIGFVGSCQCFSSLSSKFPKLFPIRVLARDHSASLEDWQKLARTGDIVWFYNGRDRKKTGKIVRNCHFGRAVSESWLNPCSQCLFNPVCFAFVWLLFRLLCILINSRDIHGRWVFALVLQCGMVLYISVVRLS